MIQIHIFVFPALITLPLVRGKFVSFGTMELIPLQNLSQYLLHVLFPNSPMGSRCTSLHDPRVDGSSPAWLHNWTKPKKKSLCVIPDALYHHRDVSRFQINPIVEYRAWKLFGDSSNPFQATYELVCNIDVPIFGRCFPVPRTSKKPLSEVQKLSIVRVMQSKKAEGDHDFVYQNKQSLNGQPALVLQTCYFRLTNFRGAPIKIDDIVKEVPKENYDPRSPMMVRADEVVFESKGKKSCNRSIWFDSEISSSGGCVKHQNTSQLQSTNDEALFCMPKNDVFKHKLPSITPYVLMQPKDDCKEGYDLIDSILKHRIGSLLACDGHICNWVGNMKKLEAEFVRLQNMHKKWMWPVLCKVEMSKIFEKTREEHNHSPYKPRAEKDRTLPSIWKSFANGCESKYSEEYTSKPRLEAFLFSEKGKSSISDKLPHIKNSPTKFISEHSDRTWKELLKGEDGPWKRAKIDYQLKSHSKDRSSSW